MFPTPDPMPGSVSRGYPGIPPAGVRLTLTRYPTGYTSMEGQVLTGMREMSMSEFVKAHAAGAAVIDVGEVQDYNRGYVPAATTPTAASMATILPIETPTLGDRSYLVHDGRVAFVI